MEVPEVLQEILYMAAAAEAEFMDIILLYIHNITLLMLSEHQYMEEMVDLCHKTEHFREAAVEPVGAVLVLLLLGLVLVLLVQVPMVR